MENFNQVVGTNGHQNIGNSVLRRKKLILEVFEVKVYEQFTDELHKQVEKTKQDQELIMAGDINDRMGKEQNKNN